MRVLIRTRTTRVPVKTKLVEIVCVADLVVVAQGCYPKAVAVLVGHRITRDDHKLHRGTQPPDPAESHALLIVEEPGVGDLLSVPTALVNNDLAVTVEDCQRISQRV